jgi:hypothetical protein
MTTLRHETSLGVLLLTQRRRPLPVVTGLGFAVEEHERFLAGVAERLAARRPPAERLAAD